ncbi:MAG TPA: hypothetical protein VMT87_14385 [Vicinamibacteria bacterium]|nr:hypothetical protein [Vicinamibacteria bacterium]
MRTASWVLLAVVGTLILLGGLASTYTAYSGVEDNLLPGGPTAQDLEAMNPGLANAMRGRRATAAAFALAYAVLFLFVVFVPYRRGEVWSWWAVLVASLTLAAVIVARVPLLDTRLGAGTGLVQLGVVVLALLLDLRRLRPPA